MINGKLKHNDLAHSTQQSIAMDALDFFESERDLENILVMDTLKNLGVSETGFVDVNHAN